MKFKPSTKEELQALVDDPKVNLGDIDTSLITDMSYLFSYSERKDFSGIEKFDVSNVSDLSRIFSEAVSFNQPLNAWNLRNVEDIESMSKGATSFDQPLNDWSSFNVTSVSEMKSRFGGKTSFEEYLDNWYSVLKK